MTVPRALGAKLLKASHAAGFAEEVERFLDGLLIKLADYPRSRTSLGIGPNR